MTLHKALCKSFTLEGIKQLCFELKVDYEELSGETKQSKVRELILYLERRERLCELISLCNFKRDKIDWDKLYTRYKSGEEQQAYKNKQLLAGSSILVLVIFLLVAFLLRWSFIIIVFGMLLAFILGVIIIFVVNDD